MINFAVSGGNMGLYDLNTKIKIARENGFIFLHIGRLTIKIYSHRRYINISYYLKHRIPLMHRQLFKIISQHKQHVDFFAMTQQSFFILHVKNGSLS